MHSHCAVIRDFIFFGLLTFQTVKSDEFVDKSVTNSSDKSTTAAAKSWASNIGDKASTLAALRDINMELHAMMNSSNQINQLIPQMFNSSLTNPVYVFNLPQDEGVKRRYLTIKKSEFMEPSFPNLTNPYVRLMKNKWVGKIYNTDDEKRLQQTIGNNDWGNRVLVLRNSMEKNDSTLLTNLQTERNFIDYVGKFNIQDEDEDKKEGSNDEWRLLGLDGWIGALSKPNKGSRPLENYNDKPQSKRSSESLGQRLDLPSRIQEEQSLLEAMLSTSIINISRNISQRTYPITNMHDVHSDGDIYIGRANNAFGHSTKWNFKNISLEEKKEIRRKRAVIELYSMIKCSTGCDPIVYKGYGCYCGFLGDGQPVNGIDQCCKLHDKCYESSNCISYLQYFVPYIWKCYRGKPLCAIDHGEWGGPTSCAARLCKCDMTLSRCLRRFICPQRRVICKSSQVRLLYNLLFNF